MQMVEMAIANGIEKVIVTPHIIPGRYDNTRTSITRAFNLFKDMLSQRGYSLPVGMAAEVRLDPAIVQLVEEGELPFIGEYQGDKFFLLEFPHRDIPHGSLELVDWLIKQNIRPIIVHPERNIAIIDKPGMLKPFLLKGCLLQITAGSLAGIFGARQKSTAMKLLKRGWVSMIATDAHNATTRPPEMKAGRKVAATVVGEERSWQMVRDIPLQITAQQFA